MANPLTLYVPIQQTPGAQAAAKYAYEHFVEGVQKGLDESEIVHYARVALIPNTDKPGTLGILLVTTFDGPMNPYLGFFWKNDGTRAAFAGIAAIALHPPKNLPITKVEDFENFINEHNLSKSASPLSDGDLYEAYSATVKEIKAPSHK